MARFGSFLISRCPFMTAIGAVEILKKLLLVDLCCVTSVRRSNCRPVRNRGSCFRISCKSEIAYPRLRSSTAATALSQKLRCVSFSSFSVLTAIADSLSQYAILLRGRFAGAGNHSGSQQIQLRGFVCDTRFCRSFVRLGGLRRYAIRVL